MFIVAYVIVILNFIQKQRWFLSSAKNHIFTVFFYCYGYVNGYGKKTDDNRHRKDRRWRSPIKNTQSWNFSVPKLNHVNLVQETWCRHFLCANFLYYIIEEHPQIIVTLKISELKWQVSVRFSGKSTIYTRNDDVMSHTLALSSLLKLGQG